MIQHWTEEDVNDFVHRLSFDFITQLAKRIENSPYTRAEIAKKLNLTKGRVSQILNNPSNLTLKRAVTYARALGMKVSIIAYDDHDPDNRNGPISSEIFAICWQKVGSPSDFQTAENLTSLQDTAATNDNVVLPKQKGFVLAKQTAHSNARVSVLLDTNVVLTLIAEKMETATNEQERKYAVGGR